MEHLIWIKKIEEHFNRNKKIWENFPLNHPRRIVGEKCTRHFSHFLKKGIPSGKETHWRGAHLSQIIANHLQNLKVMDSHPTTSTPSISSSSLDVHSTLLEELGEFPHTNRLNFQNGQINPSISTNPDLSYFGKNPSEKDSPNKIKWCTWEDFNSRLPCYSWVIQQLNSMNYQQDGFFHLASSTPVGCIIFVPPNYKSQVPLNLCFSFKDLKKNLREDRDSMQLLDNQFWNIQNFIFISEGAELTLIENMYSHNPSLVNMVVRIQHSKKSNLKWVRINHGRSSATCFSQCVCEMEEMSRLDRLSFTMGEGFLRDRVEVIQKGPKAHTNLLGLSMLQKNNQSDHRFYVQHLKPNGYSRQFYTSVLNDSSKSIFHGKIQVHPLAVQTDCSQSAKNLLLSDRAHCSIQPELAIDCAEIKAQHGASIGNLDENEMFYLKSRGLDSSTAWELLVFSYIKDILSQFPCESLTKHFSQKIREKFTLLLNLKKDPSKK